MIEYTASAWKATTRSAAPARHAASPLCAGRRQTQTASPTREPEKRRWEEPRGAAELEGEPAAARIGRDERAELVRLRVDLAERALGRRGEEVQPVIRRRRPDLRDGAVRRRREEPLVRRRDGLPLRRLRKLARRPGADALLPAARCRGLGSRQRDEERAPELVDDGRADAPRVAERMRAHCLDPGLAQLCVVGAPAPRTVAEPDEVLELPRPGLREEAVERDPVPAVRLLGQQVDANRVGQLARRGTVVGRHDPIRDESAVEREERSAPARECVVVVAKSVQGRPGAEDDHDDADARREGREPRPPRDGAHERDESEDDEHLIARPSQCGRRGRKAEEREARRSAARARRG